MKGRPIDLIGMQFGSLHVLERLPSQNRHSRWSCVCWCGKRLAFDGYKLQAGIRKSCGCRGVGDPSPEVDRLVAECRDRLLNVPGKVERPPSKPRQITRSKYRTAQERINSGYWTVDVDAGRIFRTKTGEELKYRTTNKGYRTVSVPTGQGWSSHALLHRVIWEAVHGEIPDGLEINHRNGNKSCNGIANLELCTHSANMTHAYATGLMGSRIGRHRDAA